jgi:tetratricopeptide (TPR) repeat protein
LQKVRETADPTWYPKAEGLLQDVLTRDPENAEAMAWMGGLALSRHQFSAGLDWGQKALARDPNLLAAYPVLIDAYVELGRYDDAVATSDAYIQLRPDLPSYTRVAYLRELYGDREGAIEAMQMALDTAPGANEAGAWTRVQLGNLYFNGGDLDAAEREYRRTLSLMADYAPAQAALARVDAARGDYAGAIGLLTGVVNRLPLPEYVILLGDIYRAGGDQPEADQQYALVGVEIQLLQANGVNTDLEFALFEADHPRPGVSTAQVVQQAQAALAERPSIYGHDVLAWAFYQDGRYADAQRESRLALRLGTQDALLHYHAGKIAAALGDDATAVAQLRTALEINPHFSILWSADARQTLDRLVGGNQ